MDLLAIQHFGDWLLKACELMFVLDCHTLVPWPVTGNQLMRRAHTTYRATALLLAGAGLYVNANVSSALR